MTYAIYMKLSPQHGWALTRLVDAVSAKHAIVLASGNTVGAVAVYAVPANVGEV